MKRSLWTAVLAAGVLLVAGCSSNSAGTGSAASTTAASSAAASSEAATSASSSEAATSESMSSESSGSESSAAGGSVSASVAPASLDAQTTAWFTTLCEGVAPIQELSNLSTAGQDNATAQKTGVEALQKFGAVLTETSTKLKSTPPPTFEGGTEFGNQVAAGLAESGPKLSALAQSFGAVNPNDTAAFQQATQGLTAQLTEAIAPLQQLGQLPPAVSEAVKEIPACKTLGG